MNRKRVLSVSLICVLLVSGITLVWSFSSRLLLAYNYASSISTAAKINESGTNISLLTYGDPESLRQGIEILQLLKAQNIEWKGSSTDPQGDPVNIGLKVGSIYFGKVNENRFSGNATAIDAHVSVANVLDVTAKADKVEVNVTFWTYLDTFPAVNITGLLTGNVYLKLSLSVLPLQGMDFAMYEYSGDRFSVSICGIKPMNLGIETPTNGQMVRGDVPVRAVIQVVPQLGLENVMFRTDYGEQIPMQYNSGNDRWECNWRSYNSGNRWTGLSVHAEGVETKNGQEFRYPVDTGISVEIDNPYVNSYVSNQQGLQMFGGLGIDLSFDSNFWNMQTGFNFWPQVGMSLTTPQFWMDGNIKFNCWRVDDEQGNSLFQSQSLTIVVTPEMSAALANDGGRARELKCIYAPNAP